MEKDIFFRLKAVPDYKTFKKKSKIRALATLLVFLVFGGVLFATTDINNVDEVSFIYFAITVVGLFISVKLLFSAFFKKPVVLIEGIISDVKETHRTVHEEDRLQTRVNHLYLVSDGTNEYWGQCIAEYNNGREKKHDIGERVLYFSMGAGNGFIVSL